MDSHALEYFQQYSERMGEGHFHQVIPLHQNHQKSWNELKKMAPQLCRGWFELSQLSTSDRIEFTREFWLARMPYHPNLNTALMKFFSAVDDIGIFLTQKSYDDLFEPYLVYSMADNSGFFHGYSPATDEELLNLQNKFSGYLLPGDYLSFLQIHDGFSKSFDTGITRSQWMESSSKQFQEMLLQTDPIISSKGNLIDPKTLIPFYESFGMPFYQCFWSDWYPSQEMGNVYYSGVTHTISDCLKSEDCTETMAFETFTDWLLFYLEKID